MTPMERRATAAGIVDGWPPEVFGLLADLRNHWRLAGRWIEVVELHPHSGPASGATVRLRGPVGVRRTLQTSVDATVAASELRGHARAGRTVAAVRWQLAEHPRGTLVTVEVTLASAGRVDRLLWWAGGRRWLSRRLVSAVGSLDDLVVADTGSPPDPTLPVTV